MTTGTWTVNLPMLLIALADLIAAFAWSYYAADRPTRRGRVLGFWASVLAGAPGGVIIGHLLMYGLSSGWRW